MSEREGQLSEHQEEIEAALRQLQETQQLYAKMDGFVKEKRQTLLEREAALRRESQQLELRRRRRRRRTRSWRRSARGGWTRRRGDAAAGEGGRAGEAA